VGTVARWASIAGGVALVVLAYRAGTLGGALVYEHGAASAYASPAQGSVGTGPGGEARRDEDRRGGDDDDHR
jgi:hypothetical protein